MNVYFKEQLILKNISIANNFWSRFSGYMLRKDPHTISILFMTSGSMQTTFMRFNLDIIFMDDRNRVLKILRNVRPWRFTKFYKNTSKVLEIPTGKILIEFKEGDFLDLQEVKI